MTKDLGEVFLVAGDIGAVDVGSGKHRPLREAVGAPAAFTMLDCFDRPIGRSGRVLIETCGRLMLCGASGILEQTAERGGDFAADLAPGPVRAALADLSPLRSLLVLGRGRMRVLRLAPADEAGKARARLIVLEPAGGGACATLVSVRGHGKARDRLAGRLRAAAGGVAFGDLAGVMFAENPPYDAKPAIPFDAGATAYDVANAIIAAYLAVARRNEPGVIADRDTEFLHDYRVSLRKIRSVLGLFKGVYDADQTRALKRAFSDLMAPTGRIRDLDVYLLEREAYFDLLPQSLHPGLKTMFGLFAQERNVALENLRERFKSKTYNTEINMFVSCFDAPDRVAPGPGADDPVGAYARGLIWKRYRKLCRIAAGIGADTPDTELHALRIQCKKLRYLIEFFAPLFAAKQIKPVIKPLKRLQDNLGLFNDCSVQQRALQAALERHAAQGRRTDLAVAESIGALIVVLYRRQGAQRAKVMASLAEFDSPKVQRRFRRLFHGDG